MKKVVFHGNLGRESIILEPKIGVVNPLGTTETSCVSAVEMQALGLPVFLVTIKAKNNYHKQKDRNAIQQQKRICKKHLLIILLG